MPAALEPVMHSEEAALSGTEPHAPGTVPEASH